jgi:hypothetical protein
MRPSKKRRRPSIRREIRDYNAIGRAMRKAAALPVAGSEADYKVWDNGEVTHINDAFEAGLD